MKSATENIYSYITTIATNLGVDPAHIVENLMVPHAVNIRPKKNAHESQAGKIVRNDKLSDELRDRLKSKAAEINLEICDRKGIRWAQLLRILAEEKAYIDNYPDISIPGAGRMGIRSLTHEEQTLLLESLDAAHHRCSFKRHSTRNAGRT